LRHPEFVRTWEENSIWPIRWRSIAPVFRHETKRFSFTLIRTGDLHAYFR
jgi:hypothetical protein